MGRTTGLLTALVILVLLAAGIYLVLRLALPATPEPVVVPTEDPGLPLTAPPATPPGVPVPLPDTPSPGPGDPDLPPGTAPGEPLPTVAGPGLPPAGAPAAGTAAVSGRVTDPDGQPVKGAHIRAAAELDATTSREGTYLLGGLPAGTHTLGVTHPTFRADSCILELRPGEALEHIDFVLEPGLTILGQVVDERGQPVVEARVHATVLPHDPEVVSRRATTAAGGEFRLEGLEPAEYRLRADHPDHVPGSPARHTAGATGVVLVLPRGAVLQGQVLDPSGAPLEGARVVVSDERHEGVATGAGGSFELRGLAPGSLGLHAEATGLLDSRPVEVNLTAGQQVEGVVLQLRAGVAIEGVVVAEGGGPLAGAQVVASREEQSTIAGVYVGRTDHDELAGSAESDSAGRFVITGLQEGASYRLRATLAGHAQRGTLEAGAVERAPARGVTLTLVAGASIAGLVLGPDGAPLPGASIRLLRQGDWSRVFAGRGDQATADDQGRYELVDLAPGRYLLSGRHDGYRSEEPLDITLTPGEVRDPVDLVLVLGGSITGQVVNPEGEPIPGATVFAWNQAEAIAGLRTEARDTTEPDGTFELLGIGEGTYLINASATGYLDSGRFGVMGTEGMPTAQAGDHLTITLQRGTTIAGRVVTPEGEPVTSFTVSIVWGQPVVGMGTMEMPGRQHPTTAVDGSFEIQGVRQEAIAVEVDASGRARARVALGELEPGTYRDLGEITLESGAVVSGVVVTASGRGVAEVEVQLGPASGEGQVEVSFLNQGRRLSCTSDETGAFRLTHVPSGEHRLTASHPQYRPTMERILVSSGEDLANLRLELRQGGVVVGTVTDATRQPLAGVKLEAYPTNNPLARLGPTARSTSTGDDGTYRLAGLEPGPTVVTAHLPGSGIGTTQLSRTVVVPEQGEVVCDFGGTVLCRVHGRVLGWEPPPEGTDTSGVGSMIILFAMEGSGAANQTMAQLHPDGTYEFQPMPPGEYSLMVFGSTTLPLTVPELPDFRYDIELSQGGLSGRIVRADQEAPSRAIVQAVRRGAGAILSRFAQTFSDEEGGFALRNLPAGIYDLRASLPGYGSAHRDGIQVAEGQMIGGLLLQVSPGGQMRITVTGRGGEPLPGASAILLQAGGLPAGMESLQAGTDPGVIAFGDVPPGTYRVIAGEASLGNAWVDGVQVQTGQESSITISLATSGAPLQVRVAAGGKPLAGATVEVLDATGRVLPDVARGMATIFSGTGTGADGTHTTGAFPPGTYTVRVTPPAQGGVTSEPVLQQVTVVPGAPVPVEVSF